MKFLRRVQQWPLWLQVSLLTIGCIGMFFAIGIVADQTLNDRLPNHVERSVPHSADDIYRTFLRYDSNHYRRIAEHGYDDAKETAFLPLYPMIVRTVAALPGVGVNAALLLVSSVLFVLAMVITAYWVRFELRARKSKLSPWSVLLLLLTFPTVFYFAFGYGESLFVCLTVGSLFAYRTKRFYLAAALVALATAARVQGGVIAVFYLLEYLRAGQLQKNWRRALPVVAAPIGLGIYMLFLWQHFGNPFEFIMAQKNWGRLEGNVVMNFISSIRPLYLWYVPVLGAMLWAVWKYFGWTWLVYALLYILVPLSSGRLDSLNRYMIGLPLLFLALALLLQKGSTAAPSWRTVLYVASSAFLLAWNILLFTNDYWVG